MLAGLAALGLALVSATCSQPVLKRYQKDGVQFSFYSNWKIVKDASTAANPDVRYIQVQGPQHAVVIMVCEPPSTRQTLEQFANDVAVMRDTLIESKFSVGGVKTAQVTKETPHLSEGKVAGREREGYLQEFTIQLLGHQTPMHARFYLVEGSKYNVIIMSQTPSLDAAGAEAGSDLILATLATEGMK